ncbi:histidine kinase dimerization/phospho-acceptor domain-containing protein [Natronomonas sp. EA1]|uniref:histidine kinase dimerization/phospho-acceptor domain-containing protein n=1 Tax=Natronomonas sp. EA1 TaxID=3421655 RepID=UPI003EB97493
MAGERSPPELLREFAETARDGDSFATALQRTVSLVCDATPWVYVEVWEPNAAGTALVLSPIWAGDHEGIESFRADSEGVSFARGEGLPGRVWESGEVEWLRDTASADPEVFARARAASDVGLGAAVAIPVTDGGLVAVLVFYLDEAHAESTELVALASAISVDLSAAYLRAENERLEEFVSIVSHDLRNPLGVARGYLTLAEEQEESAHLQGVAEALDRMDHLVDDLLSLAKHGTPGQLSAISVREAAERAWGNIDHATATLSVVDDQPILADENYLVELFENLLSNAVRHGGPNVCVELGLLPDGFYLEDDGPGIESIHRDSIFEPGYTTHEEGTGFGLAIVKRIAGVHGWRVGLGDCENGCRIEVRGVDGSVTEGARGR